MSSLKPVVVVGSLNVDLVVSTERFAAPGETITGQEFHTFSGGKGANQAAAAARLGYPTRMFGFVGEDEFAPRLLRDLVATGVDVSEVEVRPGSTGTALITTTKAGENSIVLVPGANQAMGPEDIDRWWVSIRDAGMVLAQLEVPMDAVERLAMRCAAEGIPFMLDPAPVRELTPKMMRTVTWLTPNESEVLQMTGTDISAADEQELRRMVKELLHPGIGGVVLKLGARGACIAYGNERRWVKPFAVDVVDTTAAGDAFNGAFAVALLRIGNPMKAAQVACAAAALSTMIAGAIPSMPTLEQVDALLARSSS